jgi:flagellar export protein FliJ
VARDPLDVLLRVRQRAVDQSRQDLATCLKVETASMEAVRAIDEAVPREGAFADRFPEHPDGMEIFAGWLKRIRASRLGAMAALVAAEHRTAAARSALAAARSAARAVEQTIEERMAVVQTEAEKRDQHAMDDITRGQRAARDREADKREER